MCDFCADLSCLFCLHSLINLSSGISLSLSLYFHCINAVQYWLLWLLLCFSMSQLVHAPAIVREIDWVNHVWPADLPEDGWVWEFEKSLSNVVLSLLLVHVCKLYKCVLLWRVHVDYKQLCLGRGLEISGFWSTIVGNWWCRCYRSKLYWKSHITLKLEL